MMRALGLSLRYGVRRHAPLLSVCCALVVACGGSDKCGDGKALCVGGAAGESGAGGKPDGGAAGHAGESGAGGASGAVGTGGASGDGGAAGSSGAGQAGEGGQAGSGGSPTELGLCDEDCRVIAQHTLDSHHFRNGYPAIAVDAHDRPHIVYSTAENGYHGYYATARSGVWSTEALPVPLAEGGIAIERATDQPLIVADQGDYTVSTWRRGPSGWTAPVPALSGQYTYTSTLARGSGSTLHMALSDSEDQLAYARFTGTEWQITPQWASGAYMDVATSPEGAVHLVYHSPSPPGWTIRWATPDTSSEPVTSEGAVTAASHYLRIAVSGATPENPLGVPHVLYGPARHIIGFSLTYATRGSSGWTTTTIANETTVHECPSSPTGPDESCTHDYVRYTPLAIVASPAGDVRFLYSRQRFAGTLHSVCEEGECDWDSAPHLTEAELYVGWPTAEGVTSKRLADRWYGFTAAIALDSQQRLHVAGYNWWVYPETGVTVEYLLVGR